MAVEVVKSRFTGGGAPGDFAWMIRQPEHAHSLFIFNDNEGEFLAHHRGGTHVCSRGGGNAVIRPYQCRSPQQAMGIPTGTYDRGVHYAGYSSLDDHVLDVLDSAFQSLDALLATGQYIAVIFSWNNSESTLATGIFHPAPEVKNHIVNGILTVAARN